MQQGYGIPQAYAGTIGVGGPQIGPQGLAGSPQTVPFGGLMSSGIGGLFGAANLPRQFGAGGIFPNAGLDPMAALYAQQAQLAPGLVPAWGGLGPQATFGNLVQNLDPVTGAYLQQNPLLRQGASPFGRMGYPAMDPYTILLLQQAQIAQQLQQMQQLPYLAQLAQHVQMVQRGPFGQPGWVGHPGLAGQQSQLGGPLAHPLTQLGRIPQLQEIGQLGGFGGYGQGIPWQ